MLVSFTPNSRQRCCMAYHSTQRTLFQHRRFQNKRPRVKKNSAGVFCTRPDPDFNVGFRARLSAEREVGVFRADASALQNQRRCNLEIGGTGPAMAATEAGWAFILKAPVLKNVQLGGVVSNATALIAVECK